MRLTNRFGSALFVLLFCAGAFWAVDAPATRSIVLVNSYHFEDVISGSVWAAENGAGYLFVLTPEQGEYAVKFLSASRAPISYFESDKPVVPDLDAAIVSASNSSALLIAQRQPGLAAWFADHSPGTDAIIVGSDDGAESVSAAPYAALEHAGLYFSDPAQLPCLLAKLKSSNRSILIYGSLASSLPSAERVGVDVLDSGSRYADNLELLKRYAALSPIRQVVFASGQVFEKSMVMGGSPVALVGLTEVSPDLIAWLKASNISIGKVISGDGDITGAQAMLTQDAGVSLFPAIGEGYPGDSQTRPLLVLPLPGPRPILVVDPSSDPLRYDLSTRTFMVGVENSDHYPAYVRVVVQLPDGHSSASSLVSLSPGETRSIPVRLDAGAYTAAGCIEAATLFIHYGSSSLQTEYIRQLNYARIPLAGSAAPPPQQAGEAQPSPGSAVVLVVLAAVLLLVAFLLRPPASGMKARAAPASRAAARVAKRSRARARQSKRRGVSVRHRPSGR